MARNNVEEEFDYSRMPSEHLVQIGSQSGGLAAGSSIISHNSRCAVTD